MFDRSREYKVTEGRIWLASYGLSPITLQHDCATRDVNHVYMYHVCCYVIWILSAWCSCLCKRYGLSF